eukprot:732624-Pleurochrysis_carterae.AAC.1
MTERHVSKYVLSTRGNSCDSFSGFAEAHEVTEVFVKLIVGNVRYLELEDLEAGFDRSSDSTFSDDDAGPSVEVSELVPDSADAEPLEEAGASSVSPHARWARAVAESEVHRWKDMQALLDAMEARTKLIRLNA